MRNFKRILSVSIAALVLVSAMLLSSCSSGLNSVEGQLNEIIRAKSFTVERVKSETENEKIMFDMENNMIYMCRVSGDTKNEAYAWYDKELGKGYTVILGNETIDKEELSTSEYIKAFGETVSEYIERLEEYKFTFEMGLWEETDTGYSFAESENSTTRVNLSVEDGALVESSNETDDWVYYYRDVNKTKVEISEKALAAIKKSDESTVDSKTDDSDIDDSNPVQGVDSKTDDSNSVDTGYDEY